MKTIIITLLLIPAIASTQEFNGFGNIKIGLPEQEFIKSITDEFKSKVVQVTEKKHIDLMLEWATFGIDEKQKPKAYKLIHEDDFLYWPYSSSNRHIKKLVTHDKSTTVYYIPVYKIASIKLENIFISFNSGSLSMINLDYDDELVKAATEKYIPTTQKDSIIRVQCKYVYTGAKTEEIGLYKQTEWDNENSLALAYYDTHFIDCKRDPIVFISFRSKSIIDFVKKKEDEELIKKKSNESKKTDSLKSKI